MGVSLSPSSTFMIRPISRDIFGKYQLDNYTIYLTQHLHRIGITDSGIMNSPTSMFVAPHLLDPSIARCP